MTFLVIPHRYHRSCL